MIKNVILDLSDKKWIVSRLDERKYIIFRFSSSIVKGDNNGKRK